MQFHTVLGFCVVLANTAAAQGDVCPSGQIKSIDTQGHCCWPGQAWSRTRSVCVGVPECPTGTKAEGDSCTTSCAEGQEKSLDTFGHCCWPGQAWSKGRNSCVGIPNCPQGMRADGDTCVLACSAGSLITADTAGHCCWPAQAWSQARQSCIGIPQCPPGMVAQGETCAIAQTAPPPEPVAQPVPPPPPPPAVPPPASGVGPAPAERSLPAETSAPKSAANMDMPPPPPGMSQTVVEQKPPEKDLRSKWFFAPELDLDAVDMYFGVHLGFSFPVGGDAARTGIGFNLGFYYGNSTLIVDLPILLSERIRLGKIHDLDIIIRAGVVPYARNRDGQTGFGVKVLGGVAFHFPLGGRTGGMAGLDILVLNGFVATPYVALTL